MTIEIPLTRGAVALIDDADAELVAPHSWHGRHWQRRRIYAAASIRDGRRFKHVYMHQLIMGSLAGHVIDHINGNTLDNRRHNLRFCTIQQNMFNSNCHLKKTFGLKGAYIRKLRDGTRTYFSSIRINGKAIYLGTFDTPEAAHAAYMEAAVKHHGEFFRAAALDTAA